MKITNRWNTQIVIAQHETHLAHIAALVKLPWLGKVAE